jgi:lipid-binding SYLF domain-containing protein
MGSFCHRRRRPAGAPFTVSLAVSSAVSRTVPLAVSRTVPLAVSRTVPLAIVALTLTGLAGPARAQMQLTSGAEEIQTVVSARQTLDEFGGLQIESIPPAMLHSASGVAIFPNMIKGGFILGVNYGKGVLLVRRPDGSWSPPVMATMGGGSLGFQAGLQAADIVLVFATPRSLQGILAGQKVTLGADASVALGPIGRQANAATDARLGAEIYSYARSRGLFLGVSVNGASISIDDRANAMLYSRFGVTPQEVFEGRGLAYHTEVQQLMNDLAVRAQAAPGATAAPPSPGTADPRAMTFPQPGTTPPTTVATPVAGQPAMPQPPTQPIQIPAQPPTQPIPPQPVAGQPAPAPRADPPLVPVQ